jgi:HD-like signal output (HDOD) protein
MTICGFPGRVSTVSNALILLGVNVVKSLAITSSIFEIMEKNVVGLWEHSMGVAVAANAISSALKLPDPEETSTAALRNLGPLLLLMRPRPANLQRDNRTRRLDDY